MRLLNPKNKTPEKGKLLLTLGGIIITIADELKTPIRFIGIGEQFDDLKPFKAREFVDALFNEV